jgi:hypothetical protein
LNPDSIPKACMPRHAVGTPWIRALPECWRSRLPALISGFACIAPQLHGVVGARRG